MKEIALTRGMMAIVDDADYEWLLQWSWHATAQGYAAGRDRDGRHMMMHREIVIRMGCTLSSALWVDHINFNRLDNRRENLRAATPQQSAHHIAKPNKHGYRGVTFAPYCYKGDKRYNRQRPWQARICVEGRLGHLSLGYYATVEEAARAYDKAALKFHGEYATLNFPNSI